MNAPFKMKPGRGNLPKTGKDIPLNMKSPTYQTDPDPKTGAEKAKIGEVPGIDELKERFKGKYTVRAKEGKTNEYSLSDKLGGSVSYSPGAKVEDKGKDIAFIIKNSLKKNK